VHARGEIDEVAGWRALPSDSSFGDCKEYVKITRTHIMQRIDSCRNGIPLDD
jgi:hypothetical protein